MPIWIAHDRVQGRCDLGEAVRACPSLRAPAEESRRRVRRLLEIGGRQARSEAVVCLSWFALANTVASVRRYFGHPVSTRLVKQARVHARVFGQGAPMAVSRSDKLHSWRIPPGRLTSFMKFMADNELVRVKPSSSTAEPTMLELRCSKTDFWDMYQKQFPEDGLKESTVLDFLKKHGVRNLCAHECICAGCMAGTEHGVALKRLLQELHSKCDELRSSRPTNHGSAGGDDQAHATTSPSHGSGDVCADPPVPPHQTPPPESATPATPRSCVPEHEVTSPLRPLRPLSNRAASQWTDASVQPDPERPYSEWQPVEALCELADTAVSHCRFEIAACFAEQSDNSVHCCGHALSEDDDRCSNETARCRAAGHVHAMDCSKCNAVFHVLGYIEEMIRALEPHQTSQQIDEWRRKG